MTRKPLILAVFLTAVLSIATNAMASAQTAGPQEFEGALLYRNCEYHSWIVRKFSAGDAWNGERTVKVTIKGGSLHINDLSTHKHTIILTDKGIGYMYNDVSKQGISGSLNFLNPYLRVLDPATPKLSDDLKMASTVAPAGTAEYKGEKCTVCKGVVTAGEYVKTDVEMWSMDNYPADGTAYSYFLNGIATPGIVVKGIYSQAGMGKGMKSTVAMELVAYRRYSVPDSEMTPPSDIAIRTATENKDILDFGKTSRKALKEKGMMPEPKNKEEAKLDIRQKWDFADEWIAAEYGKNTSGDIWQIVGDVANAISNVASQVAAESAAVATDAGGNAEDEAATESSSAESRKPVRRSQRTRRTASQSGTKKDTPAKAGEDKGEVCSWCNGSGKCYKCHGTKQCSSCDGTGKTRYGKNVTCPNCQVPGNGKCKACDATGKCSACNGTGKA